MDRSMRFVTNVKIDILCGVIGAIIAVGMAVCGFGYWSLICQTISLPIVGNDRSLDRDAVGTRQAAVDSGVAVNGALR